MMSTGLLGRASTSAASKLIFPSNSGRSAKQMVRKLLRSTRELEKLPRANRRVPEWGRDRLREIIVDKRYRVMYRIHAESIGHRRLRLQSRSEEARRAPAEKEL